MIKHYTKDDLTVVWKPELCQHSAICFHGLAEVFDPRRSPWIDMNGAELERIKEQVARCPSGALSYLQNETKA
jgi:uncharacterized Fe-S cluster protein YjdI